MDNATPWEIVHVTAHLAVVPFAMRVGLTITTILTAHIV